MIPPHTLIASKQGATVGVIFVAATIAAYEITPETFSVISVGIGALGVMFAAVLTVIFGNRNNRKNREQLAKIADDTAAALLMQQENASRLDGRLTQLLDSNSAISEAIGVKKGLQQAADTAAATAARTAARDDKVVTAVAGAVVNRIGEAADQAAQTVPIKKLT